MSDSLIVTLLQEEILVRLSNSSRIFYFRYFITPLQYLTFSNDMVNWRCKVRYVKHILDLCNGLMKAYQTCMLLFFIKHLN